MKKTQCANGCCTLEVKPYTPSPEEKHTSSVKRKKSGIFVYNPTRNSILIVQSRGNLWGNPKGTLQPGETDIGCALREVCEETGINIAVNRLQRATRIKNDAIYFYTEVDQDLAVSVQHTNSDADNDANGVGWINIDCLRKMVEDSQLNITSHLKTTLERFNGVRIKDTRISTRKDFTRRDFRDFYDPHKHYNGSHRRSFTRDVEFERRYRRPAKTLRPTERQSRAGHARHRHPQRRKIPAKAHRSYVDAVKQGQCTPRCMGEVRA